MVAMRALTPARHRRTPQHGSGGQLPLQRSVNSADEQALAKSSESKRLFVVSYNISITDSPTWLDMASFAGSWILWDTFRCGAVLRCSAATGSRNSKSF